MQKINTILIKYIKQVCTSSLVLLIILRFKCIVNKNYLQFNVKQYSKLHELDP